MTLALEVAEESIEEGGIVPSERNVGKSRPDERVGEAIEEVFDRGLVVDDEEEEEETVGFFEFVENFKFERDKDLAKTADCNLLICCILQQMFSQALRVLKTNCSILSLSCGVSLYSFDNNNNSGLSSLASRLLFSHYHPTLEEDLEKVVADAFSNSNSRYTRPSKSPSTPSSHHTPPAIPGSGQAVINRLIAANSLVYIAWQLPYDSVKRIMERWFVTSPIVFQANRTRGWASLLLCTYSHSSFFHLLANMAGLYSFGPSI